MKKIMMILLAVVAFGFSSTAQNTVKFAHIDYIKVVDSIPTMVDADAQVKSFLEMGQKKIADMEKAYEEAYLAYEAEKDALSDIMQDLREKQLMEQLQLIEYTKQSLENDLQILNDRLYGPIEKNLTKAIETVSQRHKVTYLFEKTQMLYTDPTGGLDLTNEVRIELVRLETERTASGN
jgi:Skp family chaperone for outer membrane proteins